METSQKVFLWTSVPGFCDFMATLLEARGATQHRLALRSAACVCLLPAAQDRLALRSAACACLRPAAY